MTNSDAARGNVSRLVNLLNGERFVFCVAETSRCRGSLIIDKCQVEFLIAVAYLIEVT
jgi:hypothetical protein